MRRQAWSVSTPSHTPVSPQCRPSTSRQVKAVRTTVMLVTEAGNRLRSKAIPEAFRGLPITLIYIGVLALAIYGFTGHSVIL